MITVKKDRFSSQNIYGLDEVIPLKTNDLCSWFLLFVRGTEWISKASPPQPGNNSGSTETVSNSELVAVSPISD